MESLLRQPIEKAEGSEGEAWLRSWLELGADQGTAEEPRSIVDSGAPENDSPAEQNARGFWMRV